MLVGVHAEQAVRQYKEVRKGSFHHTLQNRNCFRHFHFRSEWRDWKIIKGRKNLALENRPILSDGERTLTLLSLRCVSDVVLQAPVHPDMDFFISLSIDTVINVVGHPDFLSERMRFSEALKSGIRVVDLDCSDFHLQTTDSICTRILANKDAFIKRNSLKVDSKITAVRDRSQLKA